MLTLSESYNQTILTYLELISNSIHIFTELLPNSSKPFFESFNGRLNRQKLLEEKIAKWKCEKLSCTHEVDNFAMNYSWVNMIGHWWLYGRKWPSPPLPKRKLFPHNTGYKEIFPAPSYKTHTKKLAPTKKILWVGEI